MIYYNSCLRPNMYSELPEALEAETFVRGGGFRYEHEHRKWEYGLALKFAREIKLTSVLNVGGGNSPLSSLLNQEGMYVTEIDPDKPEKLFPEIDYVHKPFPTSGLGKHDLVVCTSVIEHVEDDKLFFSQLLDHADIALFLTMDFHPSNSRFSEAHLRTYNFERLMEFINEARVSGFMPYGSIHYKYEVPMVYDYTFAALALHRKSPTHV